MPTTPPDTDRHRHRPTPPARAHGDGDRFGPISPDFTTTFTTVAGSLIPTCRPLPRRMLGVWAHPDDEAYLSAGLMARVMDHGGQVTVVTATSGELGTDDPSLRGSAQFGRHRQGELESSLAELGVHDIRLLGLPDGGCPWSPATEPIASIAHVVDEVRPDLIVTFGPDGITGHRDHRAVSSWTTAAWQLTGCRATLLYATRSVDFERRFRALHVELGLHDEDGGGHGPATSMIDVALEVVLTPAELARKRRALARHASQTDSLSRAIGERRYLDWISEEVFRHPSLAEEAAALAEVRSRELIGARP